LLVLKREQQYSYPLYDCQHFNLQEYAIDIILSNYQANGHNFVSSVTV